MNNYEIEDNHFVGGETSIVWENLTVAVSITGSSEFSNKVWRKITGKSHVGSLEILKGASGHAVTGNMIAIMGPSGAGKTTFLAALARRIELTSGAVRLNGEFFSREIVSKISSYVPQFDTLPSYLTVEEYIIFVYALKMDGTTAQRRSLSRKLLIDLGLDDCKNILITRLSGGERKRVSLASELVTKPKILFLDEPTTGLDTFSALRVVKWIRTMSLDGLIVFCTIHQPSMDIYNLFSHAMFMTEGRVAYFGSLENVRQFFSSQSYDCPVGFDESEYYIKILSVKSSEVTSMYPDGEQETASTECIEEICRAFSRSSLSRIPVFVGNGQLEFKLQKKASCVVQFYWLTWRIWIQNRRTIFTDWIAWLSCFLSIAAVGVFYAGINPYTQEGVQDTRGALYMMSSEIIFTVAYSVIYEFPRELCIYLRESSVYACGPYYIATFLGLIPKAALKALIFTTVLYLILNDELDFVSFGFYCLCTTAVAICGISYGLMCSSWIEDVGVMTMVMVPIDILFLLTAGVFYNLRSLPVYLMCFKYCSLFYHVNEAISILYWSRIAEIECQVENDLPCLSNGDEVLSEYGYKKTNFWWDIFGLVTLTIVMNFIGFLGIWRRRATKTAF